MRSKIKKARESLRKAIATLIPKNDDVVKASTPSDTVTTTAGNSANGSDEEGKTDD